MCPRILRTFLPSCSSRRVSKISEDFRLTKRCFLEYAMHFQQTRRYGFVSTAVLNIFALYAIKVRSLTYYGHLAYLTFQLCFCNKHVSFRGIKSCFLTYFSQLLLLTILISFYTNFENFWLISH